MVTSFKFSPFNCQYFKFYWTYKLFFGANIQQHKIHLMTKSASDFDGRWRSQAKVKGHKKCTNGHILHTITLTDIIPGTKVHYKKRHLMTSAFLTLMKSQGHTTRSNVIDVEVSAFSESFLLHFEIIWLFHKALARKC